MKKNKQSPDQLVDYIRKNLNKGYSRESLKWALVNQGNSKIEIENAFKKIDGEVISSQVGVSSRPVTNTKIVEPADITHMPVEEKKGFFSRLFGK